VKDGQPKKVMKFQTNNKDNNENGRLRSQINETKSLACSLTPYGNNKISQSQCYFYKKS
jgi:hypothetical protein